MPQPDIAGGMEISKTFTYLNVSRRCRFIGGPRALANGGIAMATNVGTVDRIIRAVLGLVLLYLAFFSGVPAFEAGALKWIAALVGVVMLVVAAVRVCPIYTIFGIKTCRT